MAKQTLRPWGILATVAGGVTLVAGALSLTSGILVLINTKAK
ncbi:hypothetical protein ACFQ5J_01300 [Lacticaseibacillus baoqingensis]|uniref:Uncharacterized protein n=1 Tax=Lacticaseibacillus baoqingensis TaxID=2486013 RepID=A0ABW4E2T6_9LACO|nr:hypothetical protein [Lacticaseibacillus baoqingensis]